MIVSFQGESAGLKQDGEAKPASLSEGDAVFQRAADRAPVASQLYMKKGQPSLWEYFTSCSAA